MWASFVTAVLSQSAAGPVVCIGDSLCSRSVESRPGCGDADWLTHYGALTGRDVVALGVPGSGLADVRDQVAPAIALAPSEVLVAGWASDAYTVADGDDDADSIAREAARGDLRAILEELAPAVPRVVVEMYYDIVDSRESPWRRWRQLPAWRRMVAEEACRVGAVIESAHQRLIAGCRDPETYLCLDGLHAGEAAAVELLGSHLATLPTSCECQPGPSEVPSGGDPSLP